MAAAAIPLVTLALNMAAQYGPEVITFIRQIRKKDGTVATSVTIIAKIDEADADFNDNLKADADWFAAHGMTADGTAATQAAPAKPAAPPPVPGS